MKNISITIALSSMMLFSCGGSEGEGSSDGNVVPDTSINDFIENLSNTVWQKECLPYHRLSADGSTALWNINVMVSIDFSLKTTYRTDYFSPIDTECHSIVFDTLAISTFEITDKVTSEESIVAFGLNETFIYNSDDSDLSASYSLIFIDSEKLYFGQKSDSNLGITAETRHASISLDDYFSQIVN